MPLRSRPAAAIGLTSPEDWTADISAASVTLRGDTVAVIDLHDGWNIIANPTDEDVEWTRVEAMQPGATLQRPWAFDGIFAQADILASATSGEAYYFLNNAGLDSLAIPYPGAPFSETTLSPPPALREAAPTLTVEASRPSDARAAARISLSGNATTGPDDLDQVGPPTRFSSVALRLLQPQTGDVSVPDRQAALAHEWRPVPKDGHTFDLRLFASGSSPAMVHLSGLDSLRFRHAALLHPAASRSYDITQGPVEVPASDGPVDLKLAVGTANYVADRKAAVRPDAVTLRAYPNPTRSAATLEYTLPDADRVELVVYDVLGRQVARLVDEERAAGRHQATVPSERLASGVYFGRLHVGGRTLTQKIVVVR